MTQRARGKGDVRVTSTDASTPTFTFGSISDPERVAETLRALVRDPQLPKARPRRELSSLDSREIVPG